MKYFFCDDTKLHAFETNITGFRHLSYDFCTVQSTLVIES